MAKLQNLVDRSTAESLKAELVGNGIEYANSKLDEYLRTPRPENLASVPYAENAVFCNGMYELNFVFLLYS